jgi:hypothetical protein
MRNIKNRPSDTNVSINLLQDKESKNVTRRTFFKAIGYLVKNNRWTIKNDQGDIIT